MEEPNEEKLELIRGLINKQFPDMKVHTTAEIAAIIKEQEELHKNKL